MGRSASISSPSHASTRSASSGASPKKQRSAVTRQVWNDHAMVPHKVRDHPKPGEGELSRPMQQDDRRPVSSDQHGGRDAGQYQALFSSGGRVQQLLAGAMAARIPASGACIRIVHGRDLPSGEPSSTDARRALVTSRRDINPSGRGGNGWIHVEPTSFKRWDCETVPPLHPLRDPSRSHRTVAATNVRDIALLVPPSPGFL